MTNGGDGTAGFHPNDGTRRKMSISQKNSWTEERKRDWSESLKGGTQKHLEKK
jgi:hypothetical protein